jgi:hypothetical protein
MDHRKSLPAELANFKKLPDGTLEFVVSHEAPDLVGDVVIQRGMKTVSDRLPAQVDHSGRMADVIGYWSGLKNHGEYTTATLHLVEAGVSKMADLVRALSDSGVKLAASIGFQAKSAEPLKPKGYKFNETLLHEISVVVVPCQPLALQVMKQFGIDVQSSDIAETADDSARTHDEVIKTAKAAISAVKKYDAEPAGENGIDALEAKLQKNLRINRAKQAIIAAKRALKGH